jgi:hypothetical protein
MINKNFFTYLINEKVKIANSKKDDKHNVIDMRLYVNNDCSADIYCIDAESIDELYEKVKHEPHGWFIDFYENIKDANFAEFADVCLWKEECVYYDAIIENLQKLASQTSMDGFVEHIKANYPTRQTYNIIDFDYDNIVGTINLTDKLLSGNFEVWDKECGNTIINIRIPNTPFKQETPLDRWKKASENAITLWNTKAEEVKVEITSKYIKFFRRDDILSCYTYPPLHELKKDKKCIKELKDTMYESCMWDELKALKTWENNDCDMPPFPISVIFHSDYQGYDFKEFE